MMNGRKTAGIAISVAAFLSLGGLSLLAAERLHHRPRTDDAYLWADVIHMAPDVSGRVTKLAVRDNQRVHRNEVLYVIDQEPYQYARDQALAQLHNLQAQLAIETTQVESQVSHADASRSGVPGAQARLDLAQRTLARLAPLERNGFVTVEQLDQARTEVATAKAALDEAQQAATGARQAVRSIAPLEAAVAGARSALSLAERNLRVTVVRAPCDGIVTALDVSAGEYAVAGHPLFTIVNTEEWWAVGNFRETQLAGTQTGQNAEVYLVGMTGRHVHGIVDSLNAGVLPDEGTTADGLPRVPRSLNWVRIAQRFPVRVKLIDPPPDLVRIGETVSVVIDR
ncbi:MULTISPECIES: efflux RND transporter periplasmic adaptor subunit [Acetobacteraceae]|uniref:Uncharacterized protein n=1 Tax=Gluconobacter morbifer G707 TaxID=1088869 RepID=G6XM31_9PROT|nr:MULTISPECIES: biotin/lipoyl-binding protein [Acetobacteraceae]EHH67119.1 hypothetical protein GMO_25490 [Gluconobacter morbifer G707]